MAYIGRQLVRGQNRIYDDISSSFNGSTTAFNLTIGGDATPPAQVNQLWIILGGILQKPGTDFTVADAQVTFTTAPASGLDFWAMIQGDTSDMNAPSDGSVTPTKIATSGDFAFPADVRFKDADGSHYVGLQAPSTVSSNLVWTLPAADGSANQVLKTDGSGALGWATDSALSFSNDANNRVVTGTGSGLNGEANLTYDGNNLALAVDANGEGVNLTATGNFYPEIEFNANRSGANNTLGYLNAKWNNTEVASISFNAGADTTNKDDAYITFNTASAGTNTERMRILSGGQLCIGTTSGPGEIGLYLGDGTNPAGHIYANATHHVYLLANAYYSGGWKYLGNGEAQSLSMQDGAFVFLNAAANSSGAGQAITLTERLKIDSAGHMGLGVTPSGWATDGDFKGLQVGTGASVFGRGSGDQDRGGIAVNYYHDGSNDKYIANGNSNQIYMNDGNINFRYAAANSSGAGANITWVDTLYLKNDGNVGIGTTNPSSALVIKSETAALDVSDYPQLTIQTASTDGAANKGGGILFLNHNGTGGSFGGSIQCLKENGTSGNTAHYMRLSTRAAGGNVTERIRITSTGAVGIGTTDPDTYYAEDLVVKCAAAEGGITVRSNAANETNYLMFADGTSGNERYRGYIGYAHNTGASGGEHMQFASAGNTVARLYADGLTLNGTDTATANRLDDYEEGTHTLVPNTNLTLNSSYNVGEYTKVGNVVIFNFLLFVSSVSGTDTVSVTLPFTNKSGSGSSRCDVVGSVMHNNVNTGTAGVVPFISNGGSTVLFYNLSTNGSWAALNNGDLNANDEMYVTISYRAA